MARKPTARRRPRRRRSKLSFQSYRERQGPALPFSYRAAMRRCLLLLLLLPAAARAELPVIELGAGMHLLRAEVADDTPSRTLGLMFRQSMPQSSGMVFVFEAEAQHCMWMKNTLIPLSVA